MLLKNVFDCIYLIHLKELTERYVSSKNELNKIGLDIKDVTIIDGVKHNDGKSVEDRIIGCKLSHIKCLEDAVENNYNRILILEDDIMFNLQFNDYLENINKFLNKYDWEMFYFGGNLKSHDPYAFDKYQTIYKTDLCLTTHCYAINSTIFKEILELKKSNKYELSYNDDLINVEVFQKRGKTFVHKPRIAYQTPSFSYIRQAKRDYLHLFKD